MPMFNYTKPDLDWSKSGPDDVAIHAYEKKQYYLFFLIQLNTVRILFQRAEFFYWPKSWIITTTPSRKKDPTRILSDVAIYPCIDNPYRLNKHKG
jgi:hypothetical protein